MRSATTALKSTAPPVENPDRGTTMELGTIRAPDDPGASREAVQRSGARAESPAAPAGPTAPPEAGGPHAPPQTQRGETEDAAAERRRRERQALLDEFLADLARKAGLPGTTRLEIRVDPQLQVPQFFVVDRASGEVIRVIPHEDGARLLDQRLDLSGILVDRSS
jgi:uncharacterized FlaG/YvyC family protein